MAKTLDLNPGDPKNSFLALDLDRNPGAFLISWISTRRCGLVEIMDDDALVLLGVCCVPLADSACELSVFIRSVCCCALKFQSYKSLSCLV